MMEPDTFICRLFHRDQPFEQVEARLLGDGEMTIGRDPAADWTLTDAHGTLSRIHCTLSVRNGRITLRDLSTNGTYLENGERAPRDEAVALEPRQSIRLGALSILVDRAENEPIVGASAVTVHAPLSAPHSPVPQDWTDGAPARPVHRDASLIEAFCEGAKLDASSLSSEDPVEMMKRIGAIYQQTVLGLSALMADRARIKREHELDRTTIGARDNNPFKWSPTRKLAQDLLRKNDAGFLSDADAVRASFEDLGRHLTAVAEGANAAADLAIRTLAPETIDAEARTQASLLKSRSALCWDIHAKRHADLIQDGQGDSALKRAFAEGYDRALSAASR
jgi:predicted component of type VI protein secretion system